MQPTVSVDRDIAALAWIIGAFEHALEHDQTRLVPYLIDVSEDLVFEMELPETRSFMLGARYGL